VDVDELVDVVFFPPPFGCVVVDVEDEVDVVGRLVDVDDVVGRLVDVDVDVDVDVVVGRLVDVEVELEDVVDVEVDVDVVVGRLVDEDVELLVDVELEEVLVDVVDDVVVVVWGLAASAGTAKTSASRTPRTFPPGYTIYRLISCPRDRAERTGVRRSKGCAEQVGAAPRKARTPTTPPPPPTEPSWPAASLGIYRPNRDPSMRPSSDS
jgi:hypothetical protein